MEWMLMPLKRYADFSGRSRRKEYWMFTLGTVILNVIYYILLAVTGGFSGEGNAISGLVAIVFLVIFLGLLIPAIAVGVRRLHDQDKSGWFMLLGIVPIANIVLLVFMCMEGTRGPNQYGPDPKQNVTDVFN